jgi:hypothetical protein
MVVPELPQSMTSAGFGQTVEALPLDAQNAVGQLLDQSPPWPERP